MPSVRLLSDLEAIERIKNDAFDHGNAGRPAQAERYFRRALKAVLACDGSTAAIRALTARIYLGLAAVVAELIDVDVGLRMLEEARTWAVGSEDPALEPLINTQAAILLLVAGRPAAQEYFDAALAGSDHLDPENVCSLLLNRSLLFLDAGDPIAARATLHQCVALAREFTLRPWEFKALCNLGWAEFLSGDLPAALSAMDRADLMDVDVERGILKMDRARVLTEAGLVASAEKALLEAENEFRVLRASKDRADAQLARAECALVAGEMATAARMARSAQVIYRKRGSERWANVATLVALQARAQLGRRARVLLGEALQLHLQFQQPGHQAQRRTAALLVCELLIVNRDLVRAEEFLAGALEVGSENRIGTRIHARAVSAQLALAKGDSVAARRAITKGFAELSAHQAKFGSLDLRTASAVHGTRLVDLRIDMAMSDGRPSAVFDAAEEGRAISSRLAPIRPPADPRAAELMAELRSIVESLRDVGTDEGTALRRRRRELEAEIGARSWTHSGGKSSAPRRVSYSQLRSEVRRADVDMVGFVRSKGVLHAVVIGPQSSRVVAIGPVTAVREMVSRLRADLDALSGSRLPSPIRDVVMGSVLRGGGQLDNLLSTNLGLGARRVVMVSSGAIATVPWACLSSLRGIPVTVSPSATWWWRTRYLPAPDLAHARVSVLAGPGLDRAGDEAADVAALWPAAHLLSGPQATSVALAHALGTADIVHVAAHGRHEPQNPLFSSIRMADGMLFAHELGRVGRPTAHVVLSACELGLAMVRPGDEALGLTSVLLHHGTRSVVSGVARVNDHVAAEAMHHYHQSLVAGADPAQALADAADKSMVPLPFVCFGSS
jgi:tetratricopeptide (TPR) repeat protein